MHCTSGRTYDKNNALCFFSVSRLFISCSTGSERDFWTCLSVRRVSGAPSQHRGLWLQNGLGAGVAVRLHRVLRAVPEGDSVVWAPSSSQVAVQTHAPPLPLQLGLDLQDSHHRFITVIFKLLKTVSSVCLCSQWIFFSLLRGRRGILCCNWLAALWLIGSSPFLC